MSYLEANTIYCMDALDGLPQVRSGSAKLILADPPYFQGLTSNGTRGDFTDLAICKPFFKELFNQFKRILAPDGQVYFFTDWRGYAFYYPLFDGILGARNCICWDKGSGPGTDYSYQHEFILWHAPLFVKKSGPNVWYSKGFAAGAKATNGQKIVPAQKTLEIIEKIVGENTSPGDLVVDPFAGNGTTPAVCRKLDRNFIAFELNEVTHEGAVIRANKIGQATFFTNQRTS